MSFAMSEARRELDFSIDNRKPSVPSNVGPGSYHTPLRYHSEESKAPFGGGARRRLNMPHVELMQDMVQFRFIPAKDPKYFPNQTTQEIKQRERQFEIERQKALEKQALGVSKNNVCKVQFMKKDTTPTDGLKKFEQTKALTEQTVITSQSFDERKKKQKQKQNSKNLQRILGLLNIQRGSVTIQSEKVKVLESDDEDDPVDDSKNTYNGFFITEAKSKPQGNNNNSPMKIENSVRNLSQSFQSVMQTSKFPKIQDQLATIKKRQDQKIINWVKDKEKEKKTFINDVINQKKFMESVGPGSYNLVQQVQIQPINKQPLSQDNLASSVAKVQELVKLQKESSQLRDMILREESNLGDQSKRSKSMMTGFNIGITSLSKLQQYQQQFTHDDSDITPKETNRLFKQSQYISSQGEESRLSMLNKSTFEMTHLGPGAYNLPRTFDQSKKIYTNTSYKNLSRPHLLNKSSPNKVSERFQYSVQQIEMAKNQPGPGYYFNATPNKIDLNQSAPEIIENQIVKQNYPSFGSKEVRELKLIGKETRNLPGPGNYQLSFNLEDLLRQCEDKQLVKEIINNLQERKPNSVFLSKEPRIAVFQENKIMKEDGLEKYYNQDQKTIAENQLKISQKKLEKLVFNLKKDYPNFKLVSADKNESKLQTQLEQSPGPGHYYSNEETHQMYKTTDGNTGSDSKGKRGYQKPSAVFKSGTNRNLSPIKLQTQNINNTINGSFSHQNEYNATSSYIPQWDKKSFNMKYSKNAKELIGNLNNKSKMSLKNNNNNYDSSTLQSNTISGRINLL